MVSPSGGGLPPQLAAIPDERVVEADVREELRAGREPFAIIMAACGRMPEGGALSVRAIFEPVPLYHVLGSQGFAHHTEQLGDEDWRVWFYHSPDGEAASAGEATSVTPRRAEEAVSAADPREAAEADHGVVVLDVRNLEPPEPMVRTLAALETLPEGATLLHINQRVPQLLFPHLEARGFSYEVREQEPDLVRVFIRRASSSPAAEST